jgi:hypothetical protein
MLICKDYTAYKCSNIRTFSNGRVQGIKFSILEPVTPIEIAKLFEGNTFYFFNEETNNRMAETNDKNLVGLSITYNDDSTLDITIKLTRRSG